MGTVVIGVLCDVVRLCLGVLDDVVGSVLVVGGCVLLVVCCCDVSMLAAGGPLWC